jgi:hypothetical protein
MNPLLSPPDIETEPLEAAPARASAPTSAQALQALLLAGAAAVVWIWLWTWQGVQAYAWPGTDTGLAERGLSYLLILAPAVPVNLLAAIWLGRGGRRAQLYLAAAGALALVQAILLLTPAAMPADNAMSDGQAAVGMRFLITIGPLLFMGAWIAAAPLARAWLGAAPKPGRRLVGVETAVWCLALALAVGTGTEVRQWSSAAAEPGAAAGVFTEEGTWARLEQAVTETTDAIPAFAGFSTRTLDVVACGYHTQQGVATYRYVLTYELREPAEDAIAARWAEGDYTLTYDGATLEGTRRVTAERVHALDDTTHTVTLGYTGGEQPALHLESPCVERAGDTPECLPAQGDPTSDTVNGITCPKRN